MSGRKSQFAWASIAGAQAEPVEITEVDGRPAVYSCGCADPFFLDEPDCPVELGTGYRYPWAEGSVFTPEADKFLVRPVVVETSERLAAEKAYAKRKRHGWRGPR